MKLTQQEIIELAREAGYPDAILEFAPAAIERLVHLALERFGAGGGEPVNQWKKIGTGQWWDGFPDHGDSGGPYETRTLYTHSSPTDLRAEYLRGLEDAAKVCKSWANQHSADSGGCTYANCDFVSAALDCAEAIEALKGKQ